MPEAQAAEPTFHALLIGVDAYTVKPLHGCVNDIDAIQRIPRRPGRHSLRSASRAERRRTPTSRTRTTVPAAPATLANIGAAFDALASERVAPEDQVFIDYAGHGGRQQVTAEMPTMHRESLLPVDFNAGPSGWDVFYDFQFNAALSRIIARTRSVSVILDCCHSSGATREMVGKEMTGRFLDPAADLGREGPIPIPADLVADAAATERGVAASGEGVDVCQLIAACRAHEIANESTAGDGVRHGLFTRALMDSLGGSGVTRCARCRGGGCGRRSGHWSRRRIPISIPGWREAWAAQSCPGRRSTATSDSAWSVRTPTATKWRRGRSSA